MSRPATTRLKVNPPLGTLPVLQYCTPEQLRIDELYQRSLETGPSQSLIRKIAMFWDWSLCQPLIVSRRDNGEHFVVDGQHRLAAAKLRNDIFQLPCVVATYGTAADEAASFVALNQQRRALTALDLFKAALAASDQEACTIVSCLEAAGLALANNTNNQAMKEGQVGNVGGLQRCYRDQGEIGLKTALRILARAFPNQVLRYAGSIFPGIAAVVTDEIRLRKPIEELVDQAGELFGQVDQISWYRRILSAIGEDHNLNRRRAAEVVFRDCWTGRNERVAANRTVLPPPNGSALSTSLKPAEMAWCQQCDQRVSGAHAAKCASPFCSLKVKAA